MIGEIHFMKRIPVKILKSINELPLPEKILRYKMQNAISRKEKMIGSWIAKGAGIAIYSVNPTESSHSDRLCCSFGISDSPFPDWEIPPDILPKEGKDKYLHKHYLVEYLPVQQKQMKGSSE